MKFKFLALTAFSFAASAFSVAQTDPYIFGLRGELPATEKMNHVRIATLESAWTDARGIVQSAGFFEMGFTMGANPTNFVLTVGKIAQYSDANGALLFRGNGILKNTTNNTSTEVYIEYYGIDRRKQNTTTDARDAFAIHIWRPNTDLNITSRWEFANFHQVEIYRPVNL